MVLRRLLFQVKSLPEERRAFYPAPMVYQSCMRAPLRRHFFQLACSQDIHNAMALSWAMARRRGQLDPFLPSSQARWLIVSAAGGSPLSVDLLPPGSDLQGAFLRAVNEHRAQGWFIENEPTYPCVFARQGAERRMLTISHLDPAGAPLQHFSPWRS